MKPMAAQIESGALISPTSGLPLRFGTDKQCLLSDDGSESFPFLNGTVPVLLNDPQWAARYAADAPHMLDEYRAANGTMAAKRRRPRDRGIYSARAASAMRSVFDPLPDSALCLSIGGGPGRAHPSLCNLNIGPFPNVDIIADAHRIPYADNSVDAVYSAAVFEHLHMPDRAAAEIHRILRPGGQAFINSPFIFVYHGYPHHYQNYTLTGHRLLFERQGLTILDADVSNGPAFAVTQIMNHFIREYTSGMHGWLFKRLWRAASVLIRRIDRRERYAEKAHLLAANTYVVLEKPE